MNKKGIFDWTIALIFLVTLIFFILFFLKSDNTGLERYYYKTLATNDCSDGNVLEDTLISNCLRNTYSSATEAIKNGEIIEYKQTNPESYFSQRLQNQVKDCVVIIRSPI